MSKTNDLNLYLHPELSLLAFNERVLNMALDPQVPLLERLRFLSIFSSNMDEFFEIRVSGLKARADSGLATHGADGVTPLRALEKIAEQSHRLVELQYNALNQDIMPQLKKYGIDFLARQNWSAEQKKWLKQYFKREVLPILTPIRLDPAHPFPLTINKGLSIVVDLHDPERDDKYNIAVLPVPRALPRFVRLPDEFCEQEYSYVYLSSIIHANINLLFRNVEVVGCHQFRITRNSDLYVDLEEVEDLARTLEGELPSRLYGEAIRLEVSQKCPKRIVTFLKNRFSLDDQSVYAVDGPVNLNRLIGLPDLVNRPHIKYSGFTPSVPATLSQHGNYFEAISVADLLLHHPFESFSPVVELLRQAATDPDVLAIKQTLYRTGPDSVVTEHLMAAARSGKEVTVIIELMARFDEANNITTAERLQEAGAHVVYGMVGKKTHAKMLLIVRKEGKKLRRYAHLGTGNYHQGNTRVYTDYGLITANKEITHDVHELFMQLTTQGPNPELKQLYQSPFGISDMLLNNIQLEINNAKMGKPARVIAKVNGLSSPTIINAFYQASQAGVKVDLIVRGICCLRPGLEGVSENINVRSVVGRFLEHGRVYYFENHQESVTAPDEAEDSMVNISANIYLSSADMMPRNLKNRIEHCTPVNDNKIKQTILDDLELYLKDIENAWIMQPDGSYLKVAQHGNKHTKSKQSPDSSSTYPSAQQALLASLTEEL